MYLLSKPSYRGSFNDYDLLSDDSEIVKIVEFIRKSS